MTDDSVFLDDTLRLWAEAEPSHFTPPLLIGVERPPDVADHDDPRRAFRAWVWLELLPAFRGNFNVHGLSDPRPVGHRTLTGVIVPASDLHKLASASWVETIEMDGLGVQL